MRCLEGKGPAKLRVAYYAPLKAPDHEVPSGDRVIAQLFMQALERGGHLVELMSRLRAYDGRGDAKVQARIKRDGLESADRVVQLLEARPLEHRPQAWLTYHLYHKAPDWVGPLVCRRLGIPYLVAEASVAAKQADGPWREGYESSCQALRQASAIFNLNSQDAGGVRQLLGDDAPIHHLPPFIDAALFAAAGRSDHRQKWSKCLQIPAGRNWLLCVAMMRPGNKAMSYLVLAQALASLLDLDWCVLLVGDGAARKEVEAAFEDLPADRVRWLNQRPAEQIRELGLASDLFTWPAVDEPLGMAMLEAQACGLPVVAGRSRGVADVVRDGETGRLVAVGDAGAFAGAVRELLCAPTTRRRMARRASQTVRSKHGIDAAASSLRAVLCSLPGMAE